MLSKGALDCTAYSAPAQATHGSSWMHLHSKKEVMPSSFAAPSLGFHAISCSLAVSHFAISVGVAHNPQKRAKPYLTEIPRLAKWLMRTYSQTLLGR